MTLGDLSRTRRLAGNPSITNVADADITQGLNYGTSQVMQYTGKADWETSTNHVSYATAVSAAELFASHYVRERFNDQLNISKEHFDTATELCERIADSLADTKILVDSIAVRGKYKSFPLNSSATPYRSMSSQGQELVGVGDYDIP
jgi:hypothetical protein